MKTGKNLKQGQRTNLGTHLVGLKQSTKDIRPLKAPAGTGVYGGLYILTEHPEGLKVLETQDFMNYVKMLGKYKSGGYYTFSSKELENYLNWSYGKKKD